MLYQLKKSGKFAGVSGPLVCVVMDGIGLAPVGPGNAVALANTPTLDRLFKNYPMRTWAIPRWGTTP